MSATFAFGTLAASTTTLGAGIQAVPSRDDQPYGPPVVRRLTSEQYQSSVAEIFGTDIQFNAKFQGAAREAGLLAVGAAIASVPASDFERYQSLARSIAAQVVDEKHRNQLIACPLDKKGALEKVCTEKFIAAVGRHLYRRPLSKDEKQAQLALIADANAKIAMTAVKNPYAGLEASLTSMLSAPQFLFVWETAERDPTQRGAWRLDGASKAARISFLLWNTTPDEGLLQAAERGDLHTEAGLAREVDRLLNSPRLEAGVRAFFSDMLGFDRFDTLSKDGRLYPKFTIATSVDVPEQTLRTITHHLVAQRGDYRDLFTTKKTFLTRRLGALYRVPVEAPEGWEPYEFESEDPRAGILSHVSFTALHSHPGRSSPTLRGKAFREIFMCQRVPDPPGNVEFTIVQDTTNPVYRTARERLTAHSTNPVCAGCHKITDPIGLGLEGFNTAGEYRNSENGVKIDTSGTLNNKNFSNAAELAAILRDDPATTSCLATRLYSYAVGHAPSNQERAWLSSDLQKQFAAVNYRIPDLLRYIVTSDKFLRVTPPT